MSDRLENFVKQNHEQFDLHEPDPSIWLKINPANQTVKQERKSMRWLRIAATVAVIFAGSTAGIYFLTGEKTSPDLSGNDLYLEIMETEQYYSQMVSDRYEELKPFLVSDPGAKDRNKLSVTHYHKWFDNQYLLQDYP